MDEAYEYLLSKLTKVWREGGRVGRGGRRERKRLDRRKEDAMHVCVCACECVSTHLPTLPHSPQAPPNDIFKEFDEDNAPNDITQSRVA